MRIDHHSLWVSDPERSLAFYVGQLGMRLMQRYRDSNAIEHLHLEFSIVDPMHESSCSRQADAASLHLRHDPQLPARRAATDADPIDGYWKIGITLGDVDRARSALLDAGAAVSEPQQFLDVGYLCHLNDPDDYSIELLQHDFAEAKKSQQPDSRYLLQCRPCLAHITLRISDPDKSLAFYIEELGMRLLSRQRVSPHRFTLYFLAYSDEIPPHADLESVKNRPWLWRRPYTVLELQHRWDNKDALRTGRETGYAHIGLTVPTATFEKRFSGNESNMKLHSSKDPSDSGRHRIISDPDGYALQLNE